MIQKMVSSGKYKFKVLYISHKIKIGEYEVGGDAPVRIQSMTNTDTLDTGATVEQCIRIIREGADFIRIAVRSSREAKNLKNIKDELKKRGFDTPLIADVHFNPKIAEISAPLIDKVRINPGNFAGEDFKDKFISLLHACKKNHTAIRIGVNHGSLSERIMEKFGNTSEGMVESAMEYLRICSLERFTDAVVSIKSSNTGIMIRSNRLLVKTMMEEGMNFPVHLGITEAGDGEDGRLRSAIGIGTLLGEGIGDTIRISLTEDPEKEIPAAIKLVSLFENFRHEPDNIPDWNQLISFPGKIGRILNIGDARVPVVISSGYELSESHDNQKNKVVPDYIFRHPGHLQSYKRNENQYFPLFSPQQFSMINKQSSILNFIQVHPEEIDDLNQIEYLKENGKYVLVIKTEPGNHFSLFNGINKYFQSGFTGPIIIRSEFTEPDPEFFLLKASSEFGRFFIDRLADGIWLENPNFKPSEITNLSFGLLQAARARISRTEYISCPSCGRTLFDIQDTLAKVKAATSHLRHLKIAVMGCIVNGPGEMADADYGFVGSAAGKVTLFRNKEVVKKNIPSEYAINEMIRLIKDYGDWIEA
jgi:(E)-4-hydroxy-3-methylbut-2-enyl-diphosphate synthase